jgi:hypothetical protein
LTKKKCKTEGKRGIRLEKFNISNQVKPLTRKQRTDKKAKNKQHVEEILAGTKKTFKVTAKNSCRNKNVQTTC